MAPSAGPSDKAARQRAVALHKSGDFVQAASLYRDLLAETPQDFELAYLLGMALLQSGQAAAAVVQLKVATRLNGQAVAAWSNLGLAYDMVGRTEDAVTAFDRAIKLKPDFAEAYARKAMTLQKARQLAAAIDAYTIALTKVDDAGLWNNKGVAHRELGDADAALVSFERAVRLQPGYADAWVNQGHALRDLRKAHEALQAFEHALKLKPNHMEALVGKSWALEETGDYAGALQVLDTLLKHTPADGVLHLRRAEILRGLRQYEDALNAYTTALQHRPNDPAVYLSWAIFLAALERFDGAIAAYDMVIQLAPETAEAHFGRAEALRQLGRGDEAEESEQRARTLAPERNFRPAEPQTAAEYYARGETRRSLNRITDALDDYDRAFALDPDYPGLQGVRLHTRMHLCDWSEYETVPSMLDKLRVGVPVAQPFPLVGLPATAQDQLISARMYADKNYPLRVPLWTGEKYSHDKIRVAYLSADFHHHATAHLMAGLFEAHDKDAFEWTAFSCGKDDQTPMRQRLMAAFDHFIDVRGMTDEAVAKMIRECEIDILVDLKGYTQNSRFGILTHRCAPVQVTYLGYPGTTASAAVDYAIVDRVVVPDGMVDCFSEKLIYLPHSYQVNDNKRPIAPVAPSRAQLGLPDQGLVFCSFNQTYKITPDVFDAWMRILSRVPDSVLWLFSAHDIATQNLQRAAVARGIDAKRLIFAGHMPLDQHLARMSQADLFLDTLPCTAHTTASDALWAGVPVLTCVGETFAARVAASLLTAVGLPDMVQTSLQAYEDKAMQLAENPVALQDVRTRLAQNRLTAPLFDTAQTARHIEAGYRTIHQRCHAGMAADHVFIHNA